MNRDTLHQLASAVVDNPAFQPRDGLTFCNFALDLILRIGWGKMHATGKRANDIYDVMKKEWEQIIDFTPYSHIDPKQPIVAAQFNPTGSGHVALVLPGERWMFSGKWDKQVPVVANIGRKNGIMGVNWAFSVEPEYFTVG
jgi:hypothetical protein